MKPRYIISLGRSILDTHDYSIIATAKTEELAQAITDKMNEAATIAQLREAAREADELIRYYIVGNKRIYSELNNEEKESIRKLAALEQETK